MKNIPIIGKFIAIMAIFGLFSLAVAIYGSTQIQHINNENNALLHNESKAALMMARGNRALQAARGAIGDLMIARTMERNEAAIDDLQTSKGKFENFLSLAMAALPANQALADLKTEGLKLLDETCGPSIAMAKSAVSAEDIAKSQDIFMQDCQPQFSIVAAHFTKETDVVVAEADSKSSALENLTASTVKIMLAAVVAGLVADHPRPDG